MTTTGVIGVLATGSLKYSRMHTDQRTVFDGSNVSACTVKRTFLPLSCGVRVVVNTALSLALAMECSFSPLQCV